MPELRAGLVTPMTSPPAGEVVSAADIMHEVMDWRDHIHSDPEILSGNPVIKGSRLPVDFLLELLANGWSEDQLFDSYPNLTKDSLRAVFAFAAESTRDERAFELRR